MAGSVSKRNQDINTILHKVKLEGFRGILESQVEALCKGDDINVIWGGHPRTDGKTMILPKVKNSLTRDQADEITGYILHERGHIKNSDFEQLGEQLEKIGAEYSEFNSPEFAGSVCNALEDARIDVLTKEERAGSGEFLRKINRKMFDDGVEKTAGQPVGSEPWEAVQDALLYHCKIGAHPELEDHDFVKRWKANPHFERIKNTLQPVLDKVMAKKEDKMFIYKATREAIRRVADELKKIEEEEEKEGNKKGDGSGGEPSETAGEALQKAIKKMEERMETTEGHAGTEKFKTALDEAEEEMLKEVEEDGGEINGINPGDTNIEHDFDPKRDINPSEERDLAKDNAAQLKKALCYAFMAHRNRVTKRYMDDGMMDPDGMSRFLFQGETDIFMDVKKQRRMNTAVNLLIDVSGSMNYEYHGRVPGGLCRPTRRLATAFNEAIKGLDVQFSLSIYDGHYALIKSPNEQLSDNSIKKLDAYGGNDDPAAVRKSAQILRAFDNDRRILVFVTDGHVVSETEQACREVMASGIEVYVICVAPTEENARDLLSSTSLPEEVSVCYGGEFTEEFLNGFQKLLLNGSFHAAKPA